jgi:hypothetical protein
MKKCLKIEWSENRTFCPFFKWSKVFFSVAILFYSFENWTTFGKKIPDFEWLFG